MIPLAEMEYDTENNPVGKHLAKGDKVAVVGYVMQREHPKAIVMHPKKGFHMVELWALFPKGFRTGGVP